MTPAQVKSMFLQFIDETDTTFQTDADTNQFLELGFDEYRNVIMQHDPAQLIKQAQIDYATLQNANTLDVDLSAVTPNGFTGPIMGSTATNAERLFKLNRIFAVDSSGAIKYEVALVQNETDFEVFNFDIGPQLQMTLIGTKLICNTTTSEQIRIDYTPVGSLNFATDTYIDDNHVFHPLIAIYAARYYAIKDGGINQQLEAKAKTLETDFASFLQQQRSNQGWWVSY